jgi:hypothetical protein
MPLLSVNLSTPFHARQEQFAAIEVNTGAHTVRENTIEYKNTCLP